MTKSTYAFGGYLLMLFLVFLILKLTETIAWSWWWVTSPLWGPAALVASIFLAGLIILMLGGRHRD